MRSALVAAFATLLTVAALAQPAPAPGAPRPPVTPNDGPLSWSYGPFSYDPAGNITAIGSQSFVYDPMGRLVKSSTAQAPAQQVLQPQDYTYDVYGNLTSTTTSGLTTAHPVNAATNRLTSLAYDAAGNVTAWQPQGSAYQRNYAYDELNMLVEETVAGNAGEVTLHLYTADDERYWTYSARSTGEKSHFKIRDLNGRVLRDFALDGTTWSVFRDYVYRDGILLASLTPAEAHHVSVDHLGSPRLLTKDDRYRVGTHTYLPFGREWTDGSTQEGDVLKFTGHERDASLVVAESNALDYMHARFYSANLDRFLSVDPITFNYRKPQAWNRYAYVLNNPMGYNDPLGLFECDSKGSCWDTITVTANDPGFDSFLAFGAWYMNGFGDLGNTSLGRELTNLSYVSAGDLFSAEVTVDGLQAFTDGVIPDIAFCDACEKYTVPFAANGYYDENAPGMEAAQTIGVVTRDAAVAVASSGSTTLFGKSWINKNPLGAGRLRIGHSPHKNTVRFSIRGEWIKRIKSNGHLDLWIVRRGR